MDAIVAWVKDWLLNWLKTDEGKQTLKEIIEAVKEALFGN